MSFIKCYKCKKPFDRQYDYTRHVNKGNCKPAVIENVSIKSHEEKIQCEFCSSTFEKAFNLKRHLKNPDSTCYKQLQNKINNVSGSAFINNGNVIDSNININPTFNTTNNNSIDVRPTVNNIVLAKHGKETISHITDEVLLRILDIESFKDCCWELMRVLYFNDEVPENRNWTIVYPRNKNAGVELNNETGEFERVETDVIIDNKFSNMAFLLFPKALKLLERHFIEPFLTKTQVYNINKLGMHYGQMDISKTSKEVYENIHKMAYEERQGQMKFWGKQGHKGNHLSLKF